MKLYSIDNHYTIAPLIYRSPSQPTNIFDQFANILELALDEVPNHNQFLIVVLGDLNVKSENWYEHDKMSNERAKIDALTSQFGLQQIIKEPTHAVAEYSSSVIWYLRSTKLGKGIRISLSRLSKLSSSNSIRKI